MTSQLNTYIFPHITYPNTEKHNWLMWSSNDVWTAPQTHNWMPNTMASKPFSPGIATANRSIHGRVYHVRKHTESQTTHTMFVEPSCLSYISPHVVSRSLRIGKDFRHIPPMALNILRKAYMRSLLDSSDVCVRVLRKLYIWLSLFIWWQEQHGTTAEGQKRGFQTNCLEEPHMYTTGFHVRGVDIAVRQSNQVSSHTVK